MSFESEFKDLVAAVKEAHSTVAKCDQDHEDATAALDMARTKLHAFLKGATGGSMLAVRL